jgi:hypothetical protein
MVDDRGGVDYNILTRAAMTTPQRDEETKHVGR